MGTVILNPAAAAETVCHEEQLRLWADDMISAIGMQGDFLKDLAYCDLVNLHRVVESEIKSIIESAFDHPEARTIRRT
ncbi:hypothetical protein [uncultured Bradyrhizobium sp.]|uniref:hypothetical protein n=1 Tax=uncultured Bradyrhizobium sp. TaxID=199684 RepID=UPI0035C986EA